MAREYNFAIEDLEFHIKSALEDLSMEQVFSTVISVCEKELYKDIEAKKKQLEDEYAGYKEKYEAMKKLMEGK